MANIPTELLRTFVAVADERSFTRAAQVLGVTQPAVSAQIKRLQGLLGSDLFDRSAPGVTLTEAGQGVLDNARPLLTLNDRIVNLAGPRTAGVPLRIGIPGDVGGALLPCALADFRRRFPHQGFHVRSESSDRLLRGLHQGEIDLAVCFTHAGPRIDARHQWTERVVWIRGLVNSPDLSGPVPLVTFDESCLLTRLMTHTLEQAGREWEEVFVGTSTVGIASAVKAGLGVSATVDRFVPADITVWHNAPLPPLPEVECGIYLRNARNRGLLEELADAIARVIRPSPGLVSDAPADLELATEPQH